MNLMFMRHGEATDNAKGLISDKEIYWSVLTDEGIKTVMESVDLLPVNIDVMYVSPFPRTIQTAYYVYEKFPDLNVIIDNRIREIFYGKYSHQKNNDELDEIRKKQIAGDYFIRFGEYGENKFDIEKRLCEFLNDVYKNNNKDSNIVIVSHGSVISYMKRILNIKSSHIQKGKIEIFNNVNFEPLFDQIKKL
jgi:broad specificity phosphatase PhoE